MERFSENTLQILKKAGWFPGRHVSLDDFEAYVKQETTDCEAEFELIPNATIRNFLHEFGGLTIIMRRQIPLSPAMDSFKMATRDIPIGVPGIRIIVCVEEMEGWIGGDKLYPISINHDFSFTMMSYSGRIYDYCSGRFIESGKSGEDWIERLCNFYCGLPFTPDILIHQEVI